MRKFTPEINAGSMADIAFLLLIFFLVTTTLKVDQGIITKLPRKTENNTITVHDKNILEVVINSENQIMIENEVTPIKNIHDIAKNFIDNGGGLDLNNQPCEWCTGERNPLSSDHPSKAIIAIQSNRTASYETYVKVLDQLHRAYNTLRNNYSINTYKTDYKTLINSKSSALLNPETLKFNIQDIHKKYPILITDTQLIE